MAFNPMEHMMDLKGKQYLQVMWRLVWFREEHPDWTISTEMVDLDKETHTAVFKALIIDKDHVVLSTGYGSESVKDFRDFLEKAETKAVGRALAMLGYGTQFAPELDEEERIVDSPVPPKKPIEIKNPTAQDIQKLAKEVSEGMTMITDEQIGHIQKLARERGVMAAEIYKRYEVKSLKQMTQAMADRCILDLQSTRARK